ncbi:hypothetical protein AV650_19490 [Serratia fonticola]|nr:hypothetical protein AV650_19490 [Serratia fonticola]
MLTINLSDSLQKATSVAFLMPKTTGHIIKNRELSHIAGACKPRKGKMDVVSAVRRLLRLASSEWWERQLKAQRTCLANMEYLKGCDLVNVVTGNCLDLIRIYFQPENLTHGADERHCGD